MFSVAVYLLPWSLYVWWLVGFGVSKGWYGVVCGIVVVWVYVLVCLWCVWVVCGSCFGVCCLGLGCLILGCGFDSGVCSLCWEFIDFGVGRFVVVMVCCCDCWFGWFWCGVWVFCCLLGL